MTVHDVLQVLESWAPREIAWERDNIGLQCGDPDSRVHRVLVSLDVTEEVVAEAKRKHADLLVSHHPLIFSPVRSISPRTTTGRCLTALLKQDTALVSAHTNLDFTRDGTSFALAAKLGLQNTAFLHKPYKTIKKVVTFVPETHVERVAQAMGEAGAGAMGDYDHCSFRSEGTGTFRGNARSHPAIGRPLILERVPEVRIEMVAHEWNVGAVVQALKDAHPYEEVAYDVLASEAASVDFGMGVIGALEHPVSLRTFLGTVRRRLGAHALRYATPGKRMLQRIAVCGGSGADLLEAAIAQGADAFVTADVKYHAFHDARGRIALIDAGHFETEFPVVHNIVARLQHEFHRRAQDIPVGAAAVHTNPVHYV